MIVDFAEASERRVADAMRAAAYSFQPIRVYDRESDALFMDGEKQIFGYWADGSYWELIDGQALPLVDFMPTHFAVLSEEAAYDYMCL